MTDPVVGVIGLGILGRPIAEELVAAGGEVVVRDVSEAAVAGMAEVGAVVAGSSAEVGERCSVVLVVVQTADQCRAVVGDVVSTAGQGTTVGVVSTVTPAVIEELSVVAAGRGVDLVDAPAAGQGEASVRSRTMSVLAGGDPEVVDRLRPAIAPWAGRLLHAGPLGAGAALKLAHNVMVYLGYLSVAEALALARSAGVADGLVADVTLASGTLSPQSEVYLDILERRRLVRGDDAEERMFATYAEVAEKDLRHAVELAAAHGIDLPGSRLLSTRGRELYRVGGAGPEPHPPVAASAPVAIPERALPLFAGRPIAFVSTMRPDGLVSTNPMAVVMGDDGVVRLSTVTSRRKVRNLLADPRVTVCVVQPDNLNRYVEIRGTAILEPDADRSFIDGIARRYMGADRYPFDGPGDERVTISVVPEQVSCPSIPLADDPPYGSR